MPSLDRSFSHIDVIRIYERHLRPQEQTLVENYFAGLGTPDTLTPEEIQALRDTIFEVFSSEGIIFETTGIMATIREQLEFLDTDFFGVAADVIDISIDILEHPLASAFVSASGKGKGKSSVGIVAILKLLQAGLEILDTIAAGVRLQAEFSQRLNAFRATVLVWAQRFL